MTMPNKIIPELIPVIRKPIPADAEAICKVWIRSIRELCGPLYNNNEKILSAWCSNKTVDQMIQMIENPQNFFIIATDKVGAIIGLGILNADEIHACYLAPEYVGNGIGKFILEKLEAEALRCGVVKLKLGSTRHALEFYKSRGYEQVGTTELLFREVVPYFPMEKALSTARTPK